MYEWNVLGKITLGKVRVDEYRDALCFVACFLTCLNISCSCYIFPQVLTPLLECFCSFLLSCHSRFSSSFFSVFSFFISFPRSSLSLTDIFLLILSHLSQDIFLILSFTDNLFPILSLHLLVLVVLVFVLSRNSSPCYSRALLSPRASSSSSSHLSSTTPLMPRANVSASGWV